MSISARNRRSAEREQTTETGTVVNFRGMTAPVRPYLTPDEVERLATAARARGRHGHRDATMILLAYRHGLRVSELVMHLRPPLMQPESSLPRFVWRHTP